MAFGRRNETLAIDKDILAIQMNTKIPVPNKYRRIDKMLDARNTVYGVPKYDYVETPTARELEATYV